MKHLSFISAIVLLCSILLLASGSSPGQNLTTMVNNKTYTINQKDTVLFAPGDVAKYNRIDLWFKSDTVNVTLNVDFKTRGATTWTIAAGDTLTFNGNGTQWKTWVLRDNVTELVKGTYLDARLRVNFLGSQCGDGTRKYTIVNAFR